MTVELTWEQRELLLQLIDAALREIGPEIRHTMTSAYKDDLKEQRRQFYALRDLLHAAGATAAAAPSGASGTAVCA